MEIKNTGEVLEMKDGIIIASGLSLAGYNEKVIITTKSEKRIEGLVLNLEQDRVGIIVVGEPNEIGEGDIIETTGEVFKLDISDGFIGRVIDPLGNPLDGKGEIKHSNSKSMLMQKIAPGVIERKDVYRPIQTGIKAVDSMIPIGRGQRQLIIGDRQTGKTAIAIDTIINQKQSSEIQNLPLVKCIYVAIGQKVSKIAQIIEKLEKAGAMEYTTVIIAGGSDSAALQYMAPYTGTAIGEFLAEKGEDALIVYDDLTKHAWAYREISLLLERPSGREAYPGDIFYLHSALLERSVQFSDDMEEGSLTALPIIETQAGDVSAYIPTNIISITDGQIYLESDLFNSGVKPAINVGLSVSRVGGAAQTKPMKQVAGQLRLDLAQYRALAAFAQFGSDLDETTKKKLVRGERMVELLKQGQYLPLDVSIVIFLVFAGTRGYLDNLEINEIKEFEKNLTNLVERKALKLKQKLAQGAKIEAEIEKEMIELIEECIQIYHS
jgi:F-type H+/Na+-transporting ATPase subunit alpha